MNFWVYPNSGTWRAVPSVGYHGSAIKQASVASGASIPCIGTWLSPNLEALNWYLKGWSLSQSIGA